MYISRTCPHFGRDKKNLMPGDYVCNLLGKNMQWEFDFRNRYCDVRDFVIDSTRPYSECPYFKD